MQDIQIVAQSIEAGGGRSQSQATALRTVQTLIERIENRQDKKQDEQHPEGQNKQIGGQGLRPQGAGGPLGMGRHVIEWSDLHIHLLVLLSSLDVHPWTGRSPARPQGPCRRARRSKQYSISSAQRIGDQQS